TAPVEQIVIAPKLTIRESSVAP
ncbi:MAG: hypothetical protein JWM50_1, partial [Microbacteriaceae bacterium]|nr:hypothetical protein [Microbacteriaceae bacterium]